MQRRVVARKSGEVCGRSVWGKVAGRPDYLAYIRIERKHKTAIAYCAAFTAPSTSLTINELLPSVYTVLAFCLTQYRPRLLQPLARCYGESAGTEALGNASDALLLFPDPSRASTTEQLHIVTTPSHSSSASLIGLTNTRTGSENIAPVPPQEQKDDTNSGFQGK